MRFAFFLPRYRSAFTLPLTFPRQTKVTPSNDLEINDSQSSEPEKTVDSGRRKHVVMAGRKCLIFFLLTYSHHSNDIMVLLYPKEYQNNGTRWKNSFTRKKAFSRSCRRCVVLDFEHLAKSCKHRTSPFFYPMRCNRGYKKYGKQVT